MKNGYFKLKRAFFSHWLWDEERTFNKGEAFLDLLQMAAFKDTKRVVRGKLIELKQGELIASLRFLSERWRWGKDKVSKFLKLLETDQMTRQECRQGETVIFLCNYGKHAASEETGADSDKDADQTETRQRPDRDQTNKNKDKKGEERETPSVETQAIAWSSTGGWSGITDQDREEWREAYPACDIQRQLATMSQWLKANPAKAKKKNWRRFLTNWLTKSQERGGDIQSKPSQPSTKLMEF